MRYSSIIAIALTANLQVAYAQNVDIIGGPEGTAQTVNYCTSLPRWADVHFASYSQLNNRIAQQKLTETGDYDGVVDGMFGPQSRAALQGFQVDAGIMPANGIESPITIQQLAYATNPNGVPQGCADAPRHYR